MTATIDTTPDLAPVSDGKALREAYSCFPSGVVAVCCLRPGDGNEADAAEDSATLIGMAASSFTTVSLDPPLVSVCVQNTSTTWPQIRSAPAIGVSVFAGDQTDVCKQLAGPSQHRFDGITPLRTERGAIFVPGAAAHLSCVIHNEIQAGDHTVVLLEIETLRADPGVEPLVFHASTFRALEARKSPETK
ncbi:flavin reductase [Gordonia jinghuaiqii]|uniref:Flavin reductase family protein n=1 Tax=Gordonia jinghuaiqii TaxID=2758710 RepID=A0A7D7LSZ3_9ACTN|nr:flavin reductase family protein [Gordonia jinghuaiqii]MCR5980629.1 flavin reductase [Gordonia jinghuaiqii]QMT02685.1 flavin reductase family protein [Gordonia jinghuaiqii]